MSGAQIDGRPSREASIANDPAAMPRRAAGWLTLAATPVFAGMAVLTAAHGGRAADMLCAAAHDPSPLNGMTLMYALMAVVHAAPWVRMMPGDRS